ncbi:MAG: GNAT family N-acetyltransferase [Alphaproteobacteria bacterium]|nr:GNAT family N-acetyltransferase [Alphaproteobacteria bacterium]
MMQPLSIFPQTIKTPRLVLRLVAPTPENAEMILRIIEQNREYLEAWQGHFEYLRNVSEVRQKLEQRYAQIANNEGVLFGIYKNDELIGRIRFFDIKDNGCEIGYWLIKSANGHGYMSEALSALETELFKFGFNKIALDIDAGNTPSEHVAICNGYVLEKRLPMASWAKCVGKCDSLIYVKNKETD